MPTSPADRLPRYALDGDPSEHLMSPDPAGAWVKWADVEAELRTLQQQLPLEKCDKCGTLVPRTMIAIELEDGHPIDDPAGFQWCVVCHSQRVLANYKAQLAALTAEREPETR